MGEKTSLASMSYLNLPANLSRLHEGEEVLRSKALEAIRAGTWRFHLEIVESAMDLADCFRQFGYDDEDTKVLRVLGMRTFNAFGASIKLCLSGYYQNATLLLRDVLETMFLLDLFRTDRQLINQWRTADKPTRLKYFKPVAVRIALDRRDGFTEKKRAAMYDMFSELAGHPTMQSDAMMRPLGMDAQIGPFFDATALDAVLSEMGRLGIQVGEVLEAFMPKPNLATKPVRLRFAAAKRQWIETFYR